MSKLYLVMGELGSVVTYLVRRLVGVVTEIVAEANFNPTECFKWIGIPAIFFDKYGSENSLRVYCAICAERDVSEIKRLTK